MKRIQDILTTNLTRRHFMATAAIATVAQPLVAANPDPARVHRTRRVGILANGLHYSIGLFKYKKRPGRKLNARQFVETTHRCDGNLAKIHPSMITPLNTAELKRLRDRAEELDVVLEIHGGNPLQPGFPQVLRMASTLGCRLVGGVFGYYERPNKIASLEAWDTHTQRCRARLKEVALAAKPLGIIGWRTVFGRPIVTSRPVKSPPLYVIFVPNLTIRRNVFPWKHTISLLLPSGSLWSWVVCKKVWPTFVL